MRFDKCLINTFAAAILQIFHSYSLALIVLTACRRKFAAVSRSMTFNNVFQNNEQKNLT